jgi:hypothetical protein
VSDPRNRTPRLSRARLDELVEEATMTDADEIVAVLKRGAKRQKVPMLELPLPSPPPKGAEWIAAYRHWRKGSA